MGKGSDMAQKQERGDLRTRRTRLALRNALLTLVDQKDFEAITVQDIADQAMINRVTFYKHYTDKYQLLDAIMQEMLNELASTVDILLPRADDEALFRAIIRWLEQVAHHSAFYRMILGRSSNTPHTAKLLENLESLVVMEAGRHFGNPNVDINSIPLQGAISVRFIVAGFLGVTTWWLEQKKPLPIQEVAKQLHQLIRTSVQSAVLLR